MPTKAVCFATAAELQRLQKEENRKEKSEKANDRDDPEAPGWYLLSRRHARLNAWERKPGPDEIKNKFFVHGTSAKHESSADDTYL